MTMSPCVLLVWVNDFLSVYTKIKKKSCILSIVVRHSEADPEHQFGVDHTLHYFRIKKRFKNCLNIVKCKFSIYFKLFLMILLKMNENQVTHGHVFNFKLDISLPSYNYYQENIFTVKTVFPLRWRGERLPSLPYICSIN